MTRKIHRSFATNCKNEGMICAEALLFHIQAHGHNFHIYKKQDNIDKFLLGIIFVGFYKRLTYR